MLTTGESDVCGFLTKKSTNVGFRRLTNLYYAHYNLNFEKLLAAVSAHTSHTYTHALARRKGEETKE